LDSREGKKPTKEEKKQHAEQLEKHLETVKALKTGYVNLYNNGVDLESVFRNLSYFIFDENSKTTYYKIKPIAARKTWERYSSGDKYIVSEFSVEKTIKTPAELIDDLCSNYHTTELLRNMLEYIQYTNTSEKALSHYQYVHLTYPDQPITIKDLVMAYSDAPCNMLSAQSCTEHTRNGIRSLIDTDCVIMRGKFDWISTSLVGALVSCGLEDIALRYINSFTEEERAKANWKNIESNIRAAFTNETVKEIARIIGVKDVACRLTVKREGEYGDDRIVEIVELADITQVKKYLVKKYDVKIDSLTGNNVFPLGERIDDIFYEFIVE
jgi:predicted transcriptional regulator